MNIHCQASEHLGPFGSPPGRREQFRSGYYHYCQSDAWQPPVNIYEDRGRYSICVELAGLAKCEVGVEVVGQEIRVHGERAVPLPEGPVPPECVLRIEIDSGRFFRSIELPADADLNTAAANLDRGFLWITVEKRPA